MSKQLQEEYMCDSCGKLSPIPNETCPECGAPMAVLGGAEKPAANDSDEIGISEAEIDAAEAEDNGMPLSLEALQAEEQAEDSEPDSYGDE